MTRDVSDVTHRKRGLRFEKSQLVEIETWARPDKFVRYGCRTWWWWWWGADGKVIIERWYLSPYVEKPFNSKVIKSFVPELRSCKCFFVFWDSYVIYICLWTFYVRFTQPYIWLCNTTSKRNLQKYHIHTHIYGMMDKLLSKLCKN